MSENRDNSHDVFCPNCEEYHPVVTHRQDETYNLRGQEIVVSAERTFCSDCGELVGTDEQDEAVLAAAYAEYRTRNNMLTPEEIREIRKEYKLSQKSFAALLGMSEATINRYEQGGFQDQTHDTAIRACQNIEVMRDIYTRRGHLLGEYQRERVEKKLAGEPVSPDELEDLLENFEWFSSKNISESTGHRAFSYERFASVVRWFCEKWGEVSSTTINKLLFYSDFLMFKYETVSITGTTYRRAPYGPVPSSYEDHLRQMETSGLLVSEEKEYPGGYIGYYYKPGPESSDFPVFSPREEAILRCVSKTFKGQRAKAISIRSHEENAWRDTPPGERISYQHAQTLSISLEE